MKIANRGFRVKIASRGLRVKVRGFRVMKPILNPRYPLPKTLNSNPPISRGVAGMGIVWRTSIASARSKTLSGAWIGMDF